MNEPHIQEELATLRAELNALKQTQARQSKLRRRVGLVAMLSLVLGSGIAMAVGTFSSNTAVPATIPYEGYLEIGGVAVDGNRNMQFELLHCTNSDAATCQPDAVWDSGVVPVSVSAGRFATLLGDEAHDADTYTLANHGLFVRISVDATGDGGALTQLGQLQQIHSVPFAANAGLASKAKDFDVSGTLSASSASVNGALSASSATVNGALSAGSASIAGDLNTANASISGTLNAESATISALNVGALDVQDYTGLGDAIVREYRTSGIGTNNASAIAPCPDTHTIIGGGCEDINDRYYTQVQHSIALPYQNAWYCYVTGDYNLTSRPQARALAICLKN